MKLNLKEELAMALLPDVFKPEETDENPFAPIEAGWYTAEIIKSELKSTNDKKGKYIALSFKIVTEDPSHDANNRMVYTNLNIVNNNETAVKIARADLKKICTAVGFEGELEDTEDLHNIVMAVKLSIKPENANWPAKNETKDFKLVDEVDDFVA